MTSISVEATMHISAKDREAIEASMSQVMGEYIVRVGKLDFSEWTPDEWAAFVGVAFDMAAGPVFLHRVYVSPPYTKQQEPF